MGELGKVRVLSVALALAVIGSGVVYKHGQDRAAALESRLGGAQRSARSASQLDAALQGRLTACSTAISEAADYVKSSYSREQASFDTQAKTALSAFEYGLARDTVGYESLQHTIFDGKGAATQAFSILNPDGTWTGWSQADDAFSLTHAAICLGTTG